MLSKDLCTISSKQTSLAGQILTWRVNWVSAPMEVRAVAFFGMLFGETEDLPMQNASQFMFTPTSSDALLLSTKAWWEIDQTLSPRESLARETINKQILRLLQVSCYGYSGSSQHTISSPYSVD